MRCRFLGACALHVLPPLKPSPPTPCPLSWLLTEPRTPPPSLLPVCLKLNPPCFSPARSEPLCAHQGNMAHLPASLSGTPLAAWFACSGALARCWLAMPSSSLRPPAPSSPASVHRWRGTGPSFPHCDAHCCPALARPPLPANDKRTYHPSPVPCGYSHLPAPQPVFPLLSAPDAIRHARSAVTMLLPKLPAHPPAQTQHRRCQHHY